ncbi:hypothetical protein [Pseudomonas cedrina]|uniref:hypothetical protein n=1 Tax=Pseudomonas cedrina TaxID=651740 RepID=UPI00277D1CC3|nr:hypothetical protein [Pseudomonas cedrina]MDQ0652554.1 hypothetical protein [Pseudomonas cedrina]
MDLKTAFGPGHDHQCPGNETFSTGYDLLQCLKEDCGETLDLPAKADERTLKRQYAKLLESPGTLRRIAP